ncbi:MAG: response regulator, partial [Kiritimatiellaceae bacterium]|nr:response regulator [Kiritimatiellaceae bacterium]
SQIGAVYLLNSQGTAFEQFETLGLDAGCRTSFSAEEREGVFGSALATGHAQHITAIPSDTAFSFTTVSGSFRPLEIITLPVVGETQIAAVIYLASIRPYSQDNVRIVKHILATIAARLNGVLLFRKVQSLAERLNGQNRELEAQKQDLMTHDLEQTALNAELEVQSRELEKANRLKSVFLANMSHELRTPLNSVIALSGVLNRRLVNKIPTEEYNYLEVIEHNGQHLLSLINDILDLSRIEAGHEEIELRSFSIRELACGVVEMLEPLAWEKKIDLINRIGTDLPHLQSDSGKVRHILQNLAGNAVKFTQNGSVRLTAQQVGHDIEISVADSGIGIPPEELTRIFDEFHQVDNTATRSHGGTGLGLAIARKYAQLLGGDTPVKSIFGHGSTFTLRLPIGGSASQPVADAPSNPTRTQESSSHPHRTQAVAHSAPPVHQAGTRILLVEDSEAIVIQMSEMLVEEGYKVRTAANGIEALARIEEELPDAVILDLMMPEMDGFAVLKAIRGMERTENLPVLILTARTVTREELGFLRHNHIYQLIRKGDVSRKDLLNAIAGILPQAVSRQPDQIHTHRCRVVSVPPKILVVEDNSDNMQTMRALLADSCTMIEANCGNAGVKQAHQYQPDLILMDIALPDMDGFETLTAIRKDPSLQDIPIIAVTARTMKGDREAILDRGFDGYVSKPVDPRLLKNAITEVLHGKE